MYITKFAFNLIISTMILIFGVTSATAALNTKDYYTKVIGTLSKINALEENDSALNITSTHSSKPSPHLGVGIGSYINDFTRVDVVFEQLNFALKKDSKNFKYHRSNILHSGEKVVERSAAGQALTLNGYVDILDFGAVKLFVGAGVGIAQIKEKVTYRTQANYVANGRSNTIPAVVEKRTSKNAFNLTRSLMVGKSIELSPAINLELMYSWRDFSHVKHKLKNGEAVPVKNRYEGHHLSAALRFDL